MAVWLKRFYGRDDYELAFQRFETLFLSLHSPRDMMMISDEAALLETTVYISLPDDVWSPAFPGFEHIGAEALPKEACLLIGDQNAFQEKFQYSTRR